MPYFSQLLSNKVTDSADVTIGRLEDVLVEPHPGRYVPLKYLVIRTKRKKPLIYIPYKYVENFTSDDVSLKAQLGKIPYSASIDPHLLYLKKDVLDQQIVDISGARIVRVNDLRIGDFEDEMCVIGIDVSFRGILRRLGLEWLDFFDLSKVNLIDWRQAQPLHGVLKLDTVSQNLNKLHPADLANIIEDLNVKQGGKLVKSLDSEAAASVLEEVDPHLKKSLIKYLGPEEAARIVEKMSVEEIVDLAKAMPKEEAKLFLSYLKDGKIKAVEKLIHYPNDTAGGLMMVNFMTLNPEWTVHQATLEVKKRSPELRSLLYAYVSDEKGKLLGAVSMRTLLIAPKDQLIKTILKSVAKKSLLHVDDKIDHIIKIMTKYNLYNAAVLNEDNKVVGVVSIDDVMRHLSPEA